MKSKVLLARVNNEEEKKYLNSLLNDPQVQRKLKLNIFFGTYITKVLGNPNNIEASEASYSINNLEWDGERLYGEISTIGWVPVFETVSLSTALNGDYNTLLIFIPRIVEEPGEARRRLVSFDLDWNLFNIMVGVRMETLM